YRPFEILHSANPLRTLTHDLLIHNLCNEIAVQPLEQLQIAEYLSRVFPDNCLHPNLSGLIHRQCGGNALFMSALVEDMVKRSLIIQDEGRWSLTKLPEDIRTWIPETLEQMLRFQFEHLSEDKRRILTAGSVAGERFSVWAVSEVLAAPQDAI